MRATATRSYMREIMGAALASVNCRLPRGRVATAGRRETLRREHAKRARQEF